MTLALKTKAYKEDPSWVNYDEHLQEIADRVREYVQYNELIGSLLEEAANHLFGPDEVKKNPFYMAVLQQKVTAMALSDLVKFEARY